MINRFALSALGGVLLAACSSDQPSGPAIEINVAPLNLPGIGVACYDLKVSTAHDTVWSQGVTARNLLGQNQNLPGDPHGVAVGAADSATLCSDRFGNGAGGDIAYVGPCDASADADTVPGGNVQNNVTLWVDGLYNAGKTAEIGEWQDPCPSGCTLSVDCKENADSKVEFNLTVMRQANQGFFDVAVSFEDIFCSAKLDSCYPNDPQTASDDKPIKLLFGSDDNRDWTGVFGFACTAGPGTKTVLAYGEIAVTCGGGVSFDVDPDVEPGSNHTATSTVGNHVLHYGVYRGNEDLTCDDPSTQVVESCDKRYWNLAFDLDDLAGLGNCSLGLTATANDDNKGFNHQALLSGVGVAYPYIDVSAPITGSAISACEHHAVNDGGPVKTIYHGNVNGVPVPVPVCDQYNGATAGNVCVPVEPVTCDCPDGFKVNLNGDGCEKNVETTPTVNTVTYQVCPGGTDSAYSEYGANFYSTFTTNNSEGKNHGEAGGCGNDASCQQSQSGPYTDLPGSSVRYLDDVGVWACGSTQGVAGTSPIGEWIGFTKCIDIDEDGDYLIGLAGDNHVLLRFDGVELYQSFVSVNFRTWNVFKLHITAGTHIIELFGMNDGNVAAFGAEISGPFTPGTIDTTAQMAAANYQGKIVFSTKNLRSGSFSFDTSLDGDSGTTCPSGYALNLCQETPSCTLHSEASCSRPPR